MFSINLNGLALDLNPGQQITLVAESNLFTDALLADGSELISLSPTPRNLKALGHANVVEVAPQSEDYACLVTIGINTYPGKLRVQEVSDSGINCYVLYNLAALNCFGKNCRDFNWDVDVDTLVNQFHQGTSQFWPNTPFYFPPILNPAFYDDVDVDPADKINPFFEGLINQAELVSGQYLPIYNYIDAPDYINRNTLVPMVPVLEVFKRALASDGYSLQGEFPNSALLARLFMYNNKSLDVFGNNLLANATNILGYSASFTGDKLNFNATDNPALFSLATEQYTVTEEGNFAFEVKITIPVGLSLPGPILSLYEDAAAVEDVPFSGVDFISGQYIFIFQRSYTALQIGTVVDFRLSMGGTPQNAQVSNLSFKGSKIIGVGLIQFSPITNLAPHVPDQSFSDFFNAWLTALQLNPVVDVEKKILYLNHRATAKKIGSVANLQNAALLPITQEWQTTTGYKVFWNKPDEDERIEDTTIAEGLLLSANGSTSIIPKLPEGNTEAAVQPPFQIMEMRPISATGYHADAKTLYVSERGQSQPLKLTADVKTQRIGLMAGVINADVLAANAITGFNLVWRDNAQSIGNYVLPWLKFLQQSKRLFKVDVDKKHPLAATLQAGQAVQLQSNTFLIQKLTRVYGIKGLQKISLELRKL